ncbi:class I SAM-dependent methyltransferase [Patescibacteria group bacterium]|nr:MAG: class I SAM-dependent methyltransferase [Patescibacteria group bacterium]
MTKKIQVLSSAEGYNLAAKYYDEKEKYLNSFEQGKLFSMLGDVSGHHTKNFGVVAGKKILDVGAGTGRASLYLAKRGACVTALDISPKMLEMLKRKILRPEIMKQIQYDITTVVGDAENLPFANETFDIVLAAFLIAHLKDPRRFFDEVYRVLKDGGIFVVTNINQKDPPLVKTGGVEVLIESYYHRPEKIRAFLEELSFGVEKEIFVKENEQWVNQILCARK